MHDLAEKLLVMASGVPSSDSITSTRQGLTERVGRGSGPVRKLVCKELRRSLCVFGSYRVLDARIALQKMVGRSWLMTRSLDFYFAVRSIVNFNVKDRNISGGFNWSILNVFVPCLYRLNLQSPSEQKMSGATPARLHVSAHDFVAIFVAFVWLASPENELMHRSNHRMSSCAYPLRAAREWLCSWLSGNPACMSYR
jgi:hypothetical protein